MHRHSPYDATSTGETHGNNDDSDNNILHSYRPRYPAEPISSSFQRQLHLSSSNTNVNPLSSSTTSAAGAANNLPPLMPLFTPVLQTFQSQYGSGILQQTPINDHLQHHEDHSKDDIQYNLSTGLSSFQENLDHNETDHILHRQHYRHRQHNQVDDEEGDEANDEDNEEDDEEDDDPDASSRRNLLYAGVGEAADSIRSLDEERRGTTPYFQSNRPFALSPFALNRTKNSNTRGNHGNSSIRPTLDIGTDHEAPASLMIEMNQQQQDEDDSTSYWNFGDRARRRLQYKRPGMNAAELAMWKWVNVENLDNFLARVYSYYVGKGMYTILLERCLNLLTFAFVIGFSTYLIGCVDYSRLRHSKHLSEVIVPQCVHKLPTGTFIVLLLFATFWVGQLIRLVYDVPEMVDMRNFYTYLLLIPDEDIQSVSWHEVVNRIMKIRDNNPNTSTTATIQTTDTQRLNAHDIANRIMRKENFMIAMFNKDLIDLSIPVPMMHNRKILTRILEWSLSFCILGYVFDERGQIRKRFLKDTRRTELAEGFVAFISGSFAAVLALITIFDQELLLGLEITNDRTVFFYLGLFGTVMAVSRGMIPDQTESFDPELLIRGVVEHTHYMPSEWEGKLHTDEVRKQFALLFEYNAMLFLMEFMSLVLTPLMLCLSLANCSEKIVDFFREFTVHVDGIGYVCSFAVFDFKRHGNVKLGNHITNTMNEHVVANESKMEKSFINFKHNNPDWEPNDPEGSVYLSKLLKAESEQNHRQYQRYYSRDDPYQLPGQWGQSSAFMRPRGPGYNHIEKRSSQTKNRSGPSLFNRISEGDDDINQYDSDDGNRRDRGQQGPGVKFYLSPDQMGRGQDRYNRYTSNLDIGSGSDSGGYNNSDSTDDRHQRSRMQPASGLAFTSELGDSFVSEIGGSSSRIRPNSRREQGQDQEQDDMADSLEDERESQKKGVFGLLNQIYELNNVTK
ncbi:autophagy protein atg9 [Linnemannia zychae]|nr:autophagy protein atg9 [Linnemannia zychae]